MATTTANASLALGELWRRAAPGKKTTREQTILHFHGIRRNLAQSYCKRQAAMTLKNQCFQERFARFVPDGMGTARGLELVLH